MTAPELGRPASSVTWHDVEHGSYDADLPVWRELAGEASGPVLDLGAGTGRVAADLAARGHEVVALDTDPELLAALVERAPGVTTVTADARDFDLPTTFGLVIAPMQLLQIVGGAPGRAAVLRRAREHLDEGGRFAAAIADATEAVPGEAASPPIPDMLERAGWVFSSQPMSVRQQNGRVVVTRRRQAVSPTGDLQEDVVDIALDMVGAEELAKESEAAGFAEVEFRDVPETPDHIGSTVIVCRR